MSGLLLTGTIDTSVFNNTNVVVTDTEDRYNQYLDTITRYICESDFDSIVFVENSGYKFPIDSVAELADKNNKKFEFLFVETDRTKTIQLGKSYGEAILMEYGIKHSKLLSREEFVYKCTGRVFVKNINSLMRKSKGDNQFIAYNNIKYCFTLFFKVRRQDFLEYYIGMGNECNEAQGRAIEHVMYERTINNSVKCHRFSSYPDFSGVCGTDGQSYGCNGIRLTVKNILLKIGEYTVNPNKGKIMDIIFRCLKMGPVYEQDRKGRIKK